MSENQTSSMSALGSLLAQPPQLSLHVYSYGLVMETFENGASSRYPVSPEVVARTMGQNFRVSTGLIATDILAINQGSLETQIVHYRKPQMTGIWLDGSDEPLRVPMPGLILVYTFWSSQNDCSLFAVKRKPRSLKEPLYHAPLPNVYANGSICWGNVKHPTAAITSQGILTMTGVWQQLLGSPFGNHSVSGKSASAKEDIRKQLIKLDGEKLRKYPAIDLVKSNTVLKTIVGGEYKQ
jgi:hypothetical protein